MPVHDWTRVDAGTFHDFHVAWGAEVRKSLNRGLLPGEHYAQVEQVATPVVPDVLPLHHPQRSDGNLAAPRPGGLAVVHPRTSPDLHYLPCGDERVHGETAVGGDPPFS